MSLRGNVIANFMGQGWTALMGIAFLPLYIRYLGMEAYGLIGLYAVMQVWLSLLDMGVTPTLNREMARFTAGAYTAHSIGTLLRSLEVLAILSALTIGVGVWLASGRLASDWLNAEQLATSEVAHAIRVMAWVLALRLVEGIYRGALLGLQKQVWLNVVGAALATARWGGAAAVLAWGSPTIEAFFLWQGLMSGLSVILFGAAAHRSLPRCDAPLRFSAAAVLGVGRFAGGMMATTLLAILLTQVDKVLLSRLLSLENFGLYTFAASLAGALLLLVAPVSQAFYPRMTELVSRGNSEALIVMYHRGAQLVSVLMIPVALVMVFFGNDLLRIWTGDAGLSAKAAPLLALLAMGTMLNGLMHIPYMLQLAHGWSGFAARVNLVAVSLLVPAIFWVTPRYGATGAAWVWLLLNAGYVLVAMQFMHARLLPGEKWRWYVRDALLPALSCMSCFALSRFAQPADLGDIGKMAWVAITVILGMGSALVVSRGLRSASVLPAPLPGGS